MKKFGPIFCVFVLLLCTVCCISPFCNQSFAQTNSIRVIVDNAPVYSRADFLEIDKTERDLSLIANAKLHQVFDVLEEYDQTYKISINDTSGFILKSMAIDNQISSPQKSLNYNAEVIADANVFEKVGEDYNALEIRLKKGDKVCILDGYDQKKQYTFVSFYDGDVLCNCYIKTEVLKAYGISTTLVVSISVLVAGCTVAFVLAKLVIGKRKKISV